MATYTKLTDDEKAAIQESTIRNLEYQMYSLELELKAENARASKDADRVAFLTAAIEEKQGQITAVKA